MYLSYLLLTWCYLFAFYCTSIEVIILLTWLRVIIRLLIISFTGLMRPKLSGETSATRQTMRERKAYLDFLPVWVSACTWMFKCAYIRTCMFKPMTGLTWFSTGSLFHSTATTERRFAENMSLQDSLSVALFLAKYLNINHIHFGELLVGKIFFFGKLLDIFHNKHSSKFCKITFFQT